ncbi:hypothetical protein U8Q05_05240 [Rhizobium ruizarguesonis]|nr:hypothetical protein U8Q05_05240 [Rhizobium ruizarguesonis]
MSKVIFRLSIRTLLYISLIPPVVILTVFGARQILRYRDYEYSFNPPIVQTLANHGSELMAAQRVLATTFNMANRADVSFAAVGVVSPNAAGKNMAWDVAPGEGATANADSGYAWQDVCNINPIVHPTSGIFCAREGIKDGWAEFGYVNYNGAPTGGIRFRIGGQTVGEVVIDPSNNDPVWIVKGRIKARGFDVIP